ncbi:hypothetical protein B296_00015840 [Ensete ventricosum]|uniref:Uncharacterized protein n=1 Tax=Ensete ventricosum TaxID=4639 RepID=A0A426Z1Y6_ENSVE|nr:hypothetical protein B296_00015840 [Ensete ventricosum]
MVLVDVEEEDAAAGEGAHVAAAGGSELDGVVVEPVELRLDGLLEIDEDEDWGLPRRFRERLLHRLRRHWERTTSHGVDKAESGTCKEGATSAFEAVARVPLPPYPFPTEKLPCKRALTAHSVGIFVILDPQSR